MELHADHEPGVVDVGAAQAHAAAAGLSVDAENVLYVRKAILDEYESLLQVINTESRDYGALAAKPYGGDPVSADASVAFPERAGLLMDQCKQHVMSLLGISNHLEKAALAYGYNEGQIAAANPIRTDVAVGELNATIHAVLNPWDRG